MFTEFEHCRKYTLDAEMQPVNVDAVVLAFWLTW
jgi:hypothetical protein